MAQAVKNLPAVRETQVWSLGWEDSLEKNMATHSSTLAWRIPWMEEPGGLQSLGSQRGCNWATNTFIFTEKEELYCFASKGRHSELMPSKLCVSIQGIVRSFILVRGQGMISSWTLLWLVGDEVIGSQQHQPSGFNLSGVCVLLGSIRVTSPTWWGLQHLQNSSYYYDHPLRGNQDLTQNCAIVSPEGLCLPSLP